LAQERRATTLQTVVIVLSLLLLGLLTTMVLRQRRGARRMHALAMTDELTGVPNRRALLARLEALLQRPDEPPCAILIIDIDHFKSINDRHGHPAGDETLRVFTACLRNAVTEPAILGRLGGEEFVVILPNTNLPNACRIAEQICAQTPTMDLAPGLGGRRITVSIGVTGSAAPDTVSAVLRRADSALYAAKHAGRNCVRTDLSVEVAISPSWEEARSAPVQIG
jgi:diguanylate cyclase (GGDEF)-like protein